jgi:tungstate transport system substrate-binding protein
MTVSRLRIDLFGVIAAIALALACTGRNGLSLTLRVATTTSVQNSGLIEHLRTAFRASSGVDLLVHSTGSGRALALLEDGEADVAISHAPRAEATVMSRHSEWAYRKFAWNRFIIVGPRKGPADVARAGDAVNAFRRIADSNAIFVSRGDQSGTHEREESFWQAAGTRPDQARLIVSGRGMAQALRHADEAQAYTLTDEPTFWQLQESLSLIPVFADDPRLLNTYAILATKDNTRATTFLDWINSKEGRSRVHEFSITGRRAYEIWPDGCASESPADMPCSGTHR